MAAFTEDEIMKRKLLIDGDAGKDDRKINDLLKSFVKWCTAVGGGGSDGSEERALTYQRIILQLKNCEQSMMKSHQMLLMNRREMKNYEDLYAKIERGISDAQDKLNAAKAELATAKRIRRNRQEYDALARVIERHPSREETATKLARLESEIKQLQELKTDLNEKLEKRRKQFEILLGAAQDLHQIFKEENTSAALDAAEELIDDDSQLGGVEELGGLVPPDEEDGALDILWQGHSSMTANGAAEGSAARAGQSSSHRSGLDADLQDDDDTRGRSRSHRGHPSSRTGSSGGSSRPAKDQDQDAPVLMEIV